MLILRPKDIEKLIPEKKVKRKTLRTVTSSPKVRYKETAFVKACMQYLTLKGFLALRNNSGLIILESNGRKRAIRTGAPGSADILACSPDGRFVAIECKTEKGRLTEMQKRFLEEVTLRGGIAGCVRTLDELEELISHV